MLEFDPDAVFDIPDGSNDWRMPGALANFLAQYNNDSDSAAAKLLADLDPMTPFLRALFRFATVETAQAFMSAYRNRSYRGKGEKPKWGPKVAVRSLPAGEDLMRTVLTVAEYCSVMLELGKVPADERKATDNLMVVARNYARKIRVTTRRLYASGPDTLRRFDKDIQAEAEAAVRACFVKKDSAAILRIPFHIARIAHIAAPAGLALGEPPEDFWVEIVKADLRSNLAATGPLVEMDLGDVLKLYEHALEQRRVSDRNTPEHAAWKSLIMRIKDDYGPTLVTVKRELDEYTAKV